MKKHFVAVGFVVLAAVGAKTDLIACGDKFLVPSRGTRFQRAPEARAVAAILIYMRANAASMLPQTFAGLSMDATLRKAGYRPTSVTRADEFDNALRQGGWDLILVDLGDGPAVKGRFQGTAAPIVVAVVHDATSAELAQAKKQYSRVLKSSTKTQSFLEMIDDALEARTKAQTKANKPTR